MKVSLNWLKEFVDIDMSPDEIGETLTMAGLEVEGIERKGEKLNEFVVGKILDIKPHSKSDRLSICQVDAGTETLSVVCGATNMKTGDFSPLALPGTQLPDGTNIKESSIRGVISQGVLLAEDEMGLTNDHTGIMILNDTLKPGRPFSDIMDLEDWIMEISLTPNRVDCSSILGIAREIGALTKKKIKMCEINIKWGTTPIKDLASITVLDSKGCPRYAAGMVNNVKIGQSPFWMRYRLHSCGIRPINNVVDITNYVLLELGQPLHAFDYHMLAGKKIVVKRAEKGQLFTTLDEQIRELNDQTLMICDGKQAVAMAGIMGGLNSEITDKTNAVLIESAYFNPTMIRRSSKKISLSTEASYRFERGIDIEGVDRALKRSLMLISQLAGGEVTRGIIDFYPEPWSPTKISFNVNKANKILGIDTSLEEVTEHLSSLDMAIRVIDHNRILVSPPSYRIDMTREADITEEIARLIGYDNIPATVPSIKSPVDNISESILKKRIKGFLVSMGFIEIITYSFISPKSADILGAKEHSDLRSFVKLLNPLSQDQSVMRTSLFPGLLSTLQSNSIRGQNDLRIFEWGKVYIKGKEELPDENQVLAALITGMESSQKWYQAARETDFFDIKGIAENILEGIGIQGSEFKKTDSQGEFDHNEYARIFSSGIETGALGKVSKKVMDGYEVSQSAYVLELYIDTLLPLVKWERNFKPLNKFPAVKRDISILINRSVESADLISVAKDKGKGLIESVDIFDVYEGKGIDSKEKALAVRISYRSDKRTLTDKEVNQAHEEIIREIRRKTGGRLREG